MDINFQNNLFDQDKKQTLFYDSDVQGLIFT
jgi:hypothetical protein